MKRTVQEPHLRFLDESIECADSTSITGRHAINLIHDDARPIRDYIPRGACLKNAQGIQTLGESQNKLTAFSLPIQPSKLALLMFKPPDRKVVSFDKKDFPVTLLY
jgi:hypothetical protein